MINESRDEILQGSPMQRIEQQPYRQQSFRNSVHIISKTAKDDSDEYEMDLDSERSADDSVNR